MIGPCAAYPAGTVLAPEERGPFTTWMCEAPAHTGKAGAEDPLRWKTGATRGVLSGAARSEVKTCPPAVLTSRAVSVVACTESAPARVAPVANKESRLEPSARTPCRDCGRGCGCEAALPRQLRDPGPWRSRPLGGRPELRCDARAPCRLPTSCRDTLNLRRPPWGPLRIL
ncbi:hypothetical protein NDU88_003907 [Pleurodeles waltl]|uniref:Uncharacterized protein n=1 Tax=Pleurodeles waltl TaxID=8319 RepID=A0AAV7TR22_PLEWA|nr:hypothetical protein NDU88_003907 [Pleurodeles waltl]